MNISTVFRCVKLLSEGVACLPVKCKIKRSGVFVADENDPLDYLLNVAPNSRQNAFDFWRNVVSEILLDGNAYIIPIYHPATLNIDELILCSRGTVTHDTINDTYIVSDKVNGVSNHYSADEIIHIKGHLSPSDPARGVSVLTYARLTTDIALAGDSETYDRFISGGNIRGIVTGGGKTGGFGKAALAEVDKSAEDFSDRINSGQRIVSLPEQVQFNQLSLSSTDMQFLENRKFTVREICRFFGVHPSFVGDDSSNNYKSAEQASAFFQNYTINPILCNIEKELVCKLIAPGIADKRKIEFDRRGLYACDITSKMNFMKDCLSIGYTVNELRRLDNMEPIEGGDVPMVSANLKTLNEIISANKR